MQPIIAVVGGEDCDTAVAETATVVGRELARRGYAVICGGRGGVMEAACRGAKEAGGATIGVMPNGNHDEVNPFVDYAIVTGMGMARNVIIVQSALAVIAMDGEFGTLSEIAHALKLGIPVVGLDTWTLSRKSQVDASIVVADGPIAAVERAIRLAEERQ